MVKKSFVPRMKSAVKRYGWNELRDKCRDSSKGELYGLLMNGIGHKKRAWHISNLEDKNSKILTRFRTRNHHLAIEKGGWEQVELSDRVCTQCNVVENETHFMLCCPRYEPLRVRYLNKAGVNDTSVTLRDVCDIINSCDKRTVDNACIFIRKATKIHGSMDVP